MTDIVDSVTETVAPKPVAPVAVEPSSTKAVAGTLTGSLLILLFGFPTLLAIFKDGGIVAVLNYFQTVPGAPYIAAIGLVCTVGWRAFVTWERQVKARFMARRLPNRVAFVKNEDATTGAAEMRKGR